MNQLIKRPEEYKIWRKVLELAETIQKVTEDLSLSGSGNIRSTLRKVTFTVPSQLAEGFMMIDFKDRKDSFYRALNGLEEIRKSLLLTEQIGHIKGMHIYKINKDINELNRMIGELLVPQQSLS